MRAVPATNIAHGFLPQTELEATMQVVPRICAEGIVSACRCRGCRITLGAVIWLSAARSAAFSDGWSVLAACVGWSLTVVCLGCGLPVVVP